MTVLNETSPRPQWGLWMLVPLMLLCWYFEPFADLTVRMESRGIRDLIGAEKALELGQGLDQALQFQSLAVEKEFLFALEPLRIAIRELCLRGYLIIQISPLILAVLAGFIYEGATLERLRSYEYRWIHPGVHHRLKLQSKGIRQLGILLMILPVPLPPALMFGVWSLVLWSHCRSYFYGQKSG